METYTVLEIYLQLLKKLENLHHQIQYHHHRNIIRLAAGHGSTGLL